MMRIV